MFTRNTASSKMWHFYSFLQFRTHLAIWAQNSYSNSNLSGHTPISTRKPCFFFSLPGARHGSWAGWLDGTCIEFERRATVMPGEIIHTSKVHFWILYLLPLQWRFFLVFHSDRSSTATCDCFYPFLLPCSSSTPWMNAHYVMRGLTIYDPFTIDLVSKWSI